jgi:hypothetical protein
MNPRFLPILILALLFFPSSSDADESRYPGTWEWSSSQVKEIGKLANATSKGGDGFWKTGQSTIAAQSDLSEVLTAEAFLHLRQSLKTIPNVIQLPASPTRIQKVRFLLTIHRVDNSFPGDDEDEGFSQITKQGDGSSLAEIHLVSKWDIHPGFDNNLINCVDVGVLQGHVANLYLQLWRPEGPLPPFLASGYQTYFETYDIYKDRPTTTAISRSEFRNALQGTILKSNSLRPNLSEKINLSEEAYSKDSDLNGALASRFVLTLLSDPEYQKAAFQLITPGAKPSPKTIAAMEKSWHGSLYKTLAASRPARPTDFTTKGKVPGAASVTRLSPYGNKPSLTLMPVTGGKYDLAWHNSNQRTIHIMQSSGDGQELVPSFISGAGALLGATRLPGEMGYAIGYCKDNSHGNKNSEYWVAGVGLDGSELFNTRIFGEKNHKDVNSKGGPGGAGTARIVYNPKTKTIAFYLSHNMLWGDGVRHQGGFVGFLDTKGKRRGGGNSWFYSHNFDQRLILANGEFCALAHGDAYPRALGFSRWPGAGGKALANQPYHQIEGESGANVTNCQTGGLVALPSRKFAVVFASSNRRKAHDICVLILDENGKATKEKWLTEHKEGGFGAFPRIARDGANIFIAWHESDGMKQIVLNSKLETVMPLSTNTTAKLSPYDDLHTLDNGAIVWAVPEGGNKIRVFQIDQAAVLEQTLITGNARTQRTPKPEALAQVDREMTIKLAELNVDQTLPKEPITLPSVRRTATLTKVDKTGLLHFVDTEGKELPAVTFDKLPFPDRAAVTLSLSIAEPENKFLFGITAFYLECAGSLESANLYFGKAGPEATAQFSKFFE